MIIRNVEFAGSHVDPGVSIAPELPHVAFWGRSNVGKSSLINLLLRRTRKKVARVSARPGKTQTLNFYIVNHRFVLVDLPGFGYAKVSRTLRESWQRLVRDYLKRSRELAGVVLLIDARRDAAPADLAAVELLGEVGLPALIVVTKIDKTRKSAREQRIARLREQLAVSRDQLVVSSARTGEGRDELLGAIGGLLDAGG
ncbi:MAG: YihA family ribosome biogenesis GTP-binding protein [Gammaproteobacteria bacterium]|nr:YihA family ribosome biogenesis GTP-binding protein [Gammaproteobacteria bacterium]